MSVTPQFIGQIYKDTATGNLWRANSLTPGDWTLELQNIQVEWTPTSAHLNEIMAFTSFGSNSTITKIVNSSIQLSEGIDWEFDTVLQELDFPFLTTVSVMTLDSDSALSILTFPSLTTISVQGQITNCPLITTLNFASLTTCGNNLNCSGNSSLSTVLMPIFLPTDGKTISFVNGALSVASVNHVLARCVANAGYVSGAVGLNGQTPAAPPSGQGIADKAALILRGVNVTTD